ncbi:MAG: hypothetical protein LBL59_04005 [Xanthomonadaceae bacterium]|jgi:uncharacterized protein YbjT (DUF2867 family)|nr:hypothetical protein [Xanthomonadaceae bacterium]
MKIALVGATGNTGRQIARQALARGHGIEDCDALASAFGSQRNSLSRRRQRFRE